MQRILNTETNTAHKPRTDDGPRMTECGSLACATHDRTQVVSDREVRRSAAIDRCGSCFEDVTGY